MNQVDYTLSLQRILLLVGSISFFTLVLVGFFVSPLENPEYLLLVLFGYNKLPKFTDSPTVILKVGPE
jgi:hypothetical protein